jgi:hypothetical protein
MRRKDCYHTADLEENQFEPGSRRRVLKNLLGITSKREMDRTEGREQVRVLEAHASPLVGADLSMGGKVSPGEREEGLLLVCCRSADP